MLLAEGDGIVKILVVFFSIFKMPQIQKLYFDTYWIFDLHFKTSLF